MKIVINTIHGGFGLSDDAMERYAELKGIKLGPRKPKTLGSSHWYIDGIEDEEHYFSSYSLGQDDRCDPVLVQVVEEMGEAANGWAAELKIVEIPDDVMWFVDEYDGLEWVSEVHRTWS